MHSCPNLIKYFEILTFYFYFPQTEPPLTVDAGKPLPLAELSMVLRLVTKEGNLKLSILLLEGVSHAQQALPSLPSVLLHSGLRHVRGYPHQQGLKCRKLHNQDEVF